MDSAGPAGPLRIDSLSGRLHEQPIEGRASLQFSGMGFAADLAVNWGRAGRATGGLGTRIDLQYDVAVADLTTLCIH
jgi:hypothetical protein